MAQPRFYVTADIDERTGRVCGYYVRYDAGLVFSYFGRRNLFLANNLRDKMNKREKTRSYVAGDAEFSRASHYS